MTPSLQLKYNHYYSLHCKHLKLQGLQPKTIEAYSRAIRRIAAYFKEKKRSRSYIIYIQLFISSYYSMD